MRKFILIFSVPLFYFLLPEQAAAQYDHGFRFIRIKYTDTPSEWSGRGFGRGRGGRGGFWSHDYPTAEYNLLEAIERTTGLRVNDQPLILTLTDERIFEYPILYLCEPGHWALDAEEAKNLRKYLHRGGFILFDDFAGRDWNNFYFNIKQVFPNKEPVMLQPDHAVWSIFYDIDPIEAASAKWGLSRYDDEYYGIFDDKGRLMCIICYNQDIGDGWEHPFGRRVLAEASTVSFQMGINFIIYALTH